MVGERSGRGMTALLIRLLAAFVSSRFLNRKLVTFLARPNQADLAIIRDLMAAGKLIPVIDKHYHLTGVPEAIRYLGEGHARGKLVITLE